jgi:truncated hemoglobin YjbI
MRTAVDEAGLAPAHAAQLLGYLEATAQHMVNSPG